MSASRVPIRAPSSSKAARSSRARTGSSSMKRMNRISTVSIDQPFPQASNSGEEGGPVEAELEAEAEAGAVGVVAEAAAGGGPVADNDSRRRSIKKTRTGCPGLRVSS
ncbi:hypothetical protein SBA5_220104 [Candidatus Sulfotelmatomonas gaucii]|uniref:Uncharacterized protein n=1 Tax=Candidatus Sulfuritelmatomonas gaucii TaxID=2043161 RepID=A0A2N9L7I6_9BACT|nr:hypothetical protein SBA5_220104 [Candidatus Sulfotelmatomonas gaucii]